MLKILGGRNEYIPKLYSLTAKKKKEEKERKTNKYQNSAKMENQANLAADAQREELVNTFCEITSASKPEALFFLESHNFDLDAAVSTFFENNTFNSASAAAVDDGDQAPIHASAATHVAAAQGRSPSRSRSPSPPRPRNPPTSSRGAAGRRTGGIHSFSDLNRRPVTGSGSDSDEPQEYYTGGEKRYN